MQKHQTVGCCVIEAKSTMAQRYIKPKKIFEAVILLAAFDAYEQKRQSDISLSLTPETPLQSFQQ